jgi:carboxylesterase type B
VSTGSTFPSQWSIPDIMTNEMQAYGGSLGDSLFQNSIAASPYLPKQYEYKDWVPSQNYYAFASQAGCTIGGYGNASQTIFDCLLTKDTATLQNASITVTASVTFGTWAFLPVTDGVLVQSLPSTQLLEKRVNGRSLLVGNNANEGPSFTPQYITSESALLTWLQSTLPEFTTGDLAKVLLYYPISDTSGTKFATTGVSGPSALDQSNIATGQQQRADVSLVTISRQINTNSLKNIYAELTFVCPSYWMAEAYSGKDRTSYKYQFSALPGTHGADVSAYFGPLGKVPSLSTDYQRAFMSQFTVSKTKSSANTSQKYGVTTSFLPTRLSRIPLQLAHHPTPRLRRTRHRAGQSFPTRRRIS